MKLRHVVILSLAIVFSSLALSQNSVANYYQSSQTPVLYDNFKTSTLNTAVWSFGTNSGGSSHSVGNGILSISGGYTNGGGAWVLSNQLFTPDSITTTLEARILVSAADGGAWGFWGDGGESAALFLVDNGNLQTQVYINSGNVQQITIPNIDVTTWHNYRMEIAGNTARFYVDSVLEATHTNSVPQGKSMYVRLDRVSWGQNQTLSVDDVRLWRGETDNISGLVAYWKMEADSDTEAVAIDSSGHGHDLYLVSTPANPTWSGDVPALLEDNRHSLLFDGIDDYAYAFPITETTGSSQLTVEAWVEFDDTTFDYRVIATGEQWGITTQWALGRNGSEIRAVIYPQCCTGLYIGDTVGANLQPDQWYHVAFVYDGNGLTNADRLTIYVNGHEFPVGISGEIPATLPADLPAIRLGYEPNYGPAFKGKLDEVRIYTVARSSIDIANDAHGETAPVLPPPPPQPTPEPVPGAPVAYWKMDEVKGNVVVDSSGHGHDQTLIDATTTVSLTEDAPALAEANPSSLKFKGTSWYTGYTYAQPIDEMNGSSELTVEAWAKFDGANPSRQTLVSANQADLAMQWWFGTNEFGELRVMFADGSGSHGCCIGPQFPRAETVGINLKSDRWYHVAFVYNGAGATNADRLKMYVDGRAYPVVFNELQTFPVSLNNSHPVVSLGFEPQMGNIQMQPLLGNLDEVRIYTVARSSTDIANDAHGETAPVLPPPPPQPTPEPVPGAPVAYWKMDEVKGNVVVDSSGHGHDQTLIDAATTVSLTEDAPTLAEANPSSLKFKGTSWYTGYTYAQPIDEMNGSSELTVEAWAKFDGANPYRQTLVSANQAGLATQWWFGTNDFGELRVMFADGLASYGCCVGAQLPRAETVGINLKSDRWYHVAFVYNGAGATNADRLKMYVDGRAYPVVFNELQTFPVSLNNSHPVVSLGFEPQMGNIQMQPLLGNLDEVRIYTVARSSTDIANDAHGETAPVLPPPPPQPTPEPVPGAPVAYWKMDEVNGNVVVDSSGHGHDQTLIDTTTTVSLTKDAPALAGANPFSLKFKGTSWYTGYTYAQPIDEMNGSSELTVEAWVKFDGANPYRQTLVSAYQAGLATQWWFGTNEFGELRVMFADGPAYNGCCVGGQLPRAETVGINLKSDRWYHVAFVYNGAGATNADRLKMYVDGRAYPVVAYELQAIPASLNNSHPIVSLGFEPQMGNIQMQPLLGNLDEVRIYTVARSSTDIANDAHGQTIIEPRPQRPDLTLSSSDISFLPLNPNPGNAVTITAHILNQGVTDTNNVRVRFFDFDTVLGETTISNLGVGVTVETSVQTTFTQTGYNLITVKVDPDNAIAESNESNNEASKVLQVGRPNFSTASMFVQAAQSSTCRSGATAVNGQAYYDFATVPGQQDFPVQGARVTVLLTDPATNSILGTFVGSHTTSDGSFSQGILAPATDGVYPLQIVITDYTITGTLQTTLQVSGACPTPPIPGPTPPPHPTPPGPPQRDVYVFSDGIQFDNLNPNIGEPTTVFAYIYYSGADPTGDIPVTLNDIFPIGGALRTFPIGNTTVSFPGGTATNFAVVSLPWTNSAEGAHIIQAAVAPPFAQYTGNDQATRLVVVGTPTQFTAINKTAALLIDADSNGTFSAGDTLQYTIMATNTGTTTLTGANIVDTYDAALLESPTNIGSGGTVSGTTISWTLGTLPAGAVQIVTYTIQIKPPSAFQFGISAIVNNAWLTTDQTPSIVGSAVVTVTRTISIITIDHQAVTINEGQTATNTGVVSDTASIPVTVTASIGAITAHGDGSWSWNFSTTDGPSQSQTVTVTASDALGGIASKAFSLIVNNVPPLVGTITVPLDPVRVNTSITATASFDDPGVFDIHTAIWSWGDGSTTTGLINEANGSGHVNGSHAYTATGIYTVGMVVTDSDHAASSIVTSTVVVTTNVRVMVSLFDSTGHPLSGGEVQYYSGGWQTFGTTNANGSVVKYLPPNTYNFRLTYGGASNQKSQNVLANSTVVFQTTNVTVELRNSIGTLIDSGAAQYYAGTWRTFGSGTTSGGRISMELLPNTYNFQLTYAGASNQKSQDIGANSTVAFQTRNVLIELRNSSGMLLDTGSIEYYAGGWQTVGATSGGRVSKELLPNTYNFRLTYAGATNQQSQDIGGDAIVVFQTKSVTIELRNSSGALIDTGSVEYYAGGWQIVGATSGGRVSKELLPNTYNFRLTYAGAANQKSQDVSVDETVMFQTKNVTIELRNSNDMLIDSGTVQYYAGTWRMFGSGSTSGGKVSMELLPNTYNFQLAYGGAANQKSQDIGANAIVAFQTKSVTVELRNSSGALIDPAMVQYYAGTWRTFGSGVTSGGRLSMELLPNTYNFQLTYAGASNQKSQDIGANSTVAFQTRNVTVELRNGSGALIDPGTVQYYAGTWRSFGSGTTSGGRISMELLPNTYNFRMTYNGVTSQKSQDIAANPIVGFQIP